MSSTTGQSSMLPNFIPNCIEVWCFLFPSAEQCSAAWLLRLLPCVLQLPLFPERGEPAADNGHHTGGRHHRSLPAIGQSMDTGEPPLHPLVGHSPLVLALHSCCVSVYWQLQAQGIIDPSLMLKSCATRMDVGSISFPGISA